MHRKSITLVQCHKMSIYFKNANTLQIETFLLCFCPVFLSKEINSVISLPSYTQQSSMYDHLFHIFINSYNLTQSVTKENRINNCIVFYLIFNSFIYFMLFHSIIYLHITNACINQRLIGAARSDYGSWIKYRYTSLKT